MQARIMPLTAFSGGIDFEGGHGGEKFLDQAELIWQFCCDAVERCELRG